MRPFRNPRARAAFAAIMACSFLILGSGCALGAVESASAVRGRLDASGIDFGAGAILRLNGEWEFYPGVLLEPAHFRDPAGLRDPAAEPAPENLTVVPGRWGSSLVFAPSGPEQGVGTLRLRVKLPHKGRWALRIPDADSAVRVYVDDAAVAEIGKVSLDAQQYVPSNRLAMAEFSTEQPDIDILMQIANFSSPYIGTWDSMLIGTPGAIGRKRLFDTVSTALVSGALFIMGLYHFGLYLLRRKDKASLYFGFICVLMGIRNMIMGERLLLELFPETLSAWAWAFKLEHFSAHFVVPLFLLFFRELYPTRIRRVPFFLIIAVGMAWAGMILFLPPALYQRFLHVYEVFLLAAGAYVLFVLATALKGGDRDASIAVAGLAILVATAANDVLLSTGVIRGSFYMASIGVFLYIFAQSFHLSLIFSRAFREVEDLNRSLKNKNRELESLHTIDLAIASSMELDRVLEIILEQAVSRLGMDAADVLLLDSAAPASAGVAERDTLRCAARLGFRTDALIHTRLRIGEGYAGKAIQTGNAVLVEALDTDSAGFSRSPAFAGENFCFYASRPLSVRGKVEGVLELYRRSPFAQVPSWEQYFETLAAQAAVALDNSFLLQSLKLANAELLASYESTIESWAGALELRDQETEGHSRRVTAATTELAQRFGFAGAELDNLRRGALLHDIGKMGIPDTILLKPGPLTDEEFIVMKRHPAIARNLLIRLRFLEPSMDIPYSHHEKWDGRGYPQGLRGTDIPLSARLFAVVDVWDALRSDRPYRAAWDEEKTLAHIASLAGTHFDPEVAEAFIGMRRGYRA